MTEYPVVQTGEGVTRQALADDPAPVMAASASRRAS